MRYIIWSDGSTRRWHIDDTKLDTTIEGNFQHEGDAQKRADVLNQEELDRIESEAYAQLKREEAIENGTRHDVHEPTTYDLAEQEMKYEERMHKFLFDDKYGVA
jgi:hypothetical protein